MSDSHARFLAHCFLHLAGPSERLPSAWVGGQMAQLDRLDGDIDTLMARIAHIRTWTYITHRSDWIEAAADWQERARGIEDRLSDALHESITQRFVDRRSAFLVRHLAGDGELLASVDKEGEVRVEGTYVGRLDGFRFVPDAADGEAMRTLITAANRVLRGEVAARARRLAAEPDEAFAIDAARRAALARRAGRPHGRRRVDADPAGRGAGRRFSRRRGPRAGAPAAAGFCQRRDRAPAGAAVRGAALPLDGPARGLVFQLATALGCVATADIAAPVKSLDRASRRALAGLACGSAPRPSISSRCWAPMRCGFARCCGRCGTADRCRRCRARAPRQGDPGRSGHCRPRFTPRSAGAWSAAGAAAGPAGAAGGGGAGSRAELGRLPPMPSLPRSPASLPASCAGFCWRSAIAPSSRAMREFFVGKPRRGRPSSESADAPPAAARGPSLCQAEGAAIRLSRE